MIGYVILEFKVRSKYQTNLGILANINLIKRKEN